MIKSGLAICSGLIFTLIALYIVKKESLIDDEDDHDKYKILLENVY